MQTIEDILKISPIIPVIVIEDIQAALPLAKALIDGGINIVEITLRTKCALDAIRVIRNEIPDMCIGAGTVNNIELMKKVVEANAQFIVCPGITRSLMDAAKSEGVQLLPGAVTPSEMMALAEYGYTNLKFFPAEAAGGTDMLKSVAGPLADIQFCPTGGIDINNYQDYLKLTNVTCIGTSWVADKNLIREKNWNEITNRAATLLANA